MTTAVVNEREEALTDLVEERVLSRREQARLSQEAEEAEAQRLATLQRHQDNAVAAVNAREVLVPAFVEKLTETLGLASKLLDAHEAYVKARTGAEKSGGSLTVAYPSPPFGVPSTERRLMEHARQVLFSLGGRV